MVLKSAWRFPPPLPAKELNTPTASFSLIIFADGQRIEVKRQYQTALKKDLPSDPTFCETIITSMPLQTFTQIGNANEVNFQIGDVVFPMDNQGILAMWYFSDIVRDTQRQY